MDNMKEIAAVRAEARRQGISYGKLVGKLTEWEKRRIIEKAKEKKRVKGAAP